jgi:hypothetical protein
MKKFTITGVRTIDEYVTYTVEAETEEEAIEMVENGEVENNDDYWQTRFYAIVIKYGAINS